MIARLRIVTVAIIPRPGFNDRYQRPCVLTRHTAVLILAFAAAVTCFVMVREGAPSTSRDAGSDKDVDGRPSPAMTRRG